MNNFFFHADTIFLIIWIAVMLYGFYKYYKNTDFQDISLIRFVFISLICTFMGLITAMFFVDFGFVMLLLFTGMFIKIGKYYFVEKTRHVLMFISAYFVAVIASHFIATRCKNSLLSQIFIICFLVGVFLLGLKFFYYYLAHDFRK